MDFESTKDGYHNLYSKMAILPSRAQEAKTICQRLIKDRARYENPCGVPWYFVAILHVREASAGAFDRYLGNGQRLNAVTTNVPAGRGPFKTFEEGVIDALTYMGYDKISDWSVEHMLYLFEKFNGPGYFGRINSPYVWSWSNLYSIGKFDVDGHYVASLVDQQPGCAVLLKTIMGLLKMDDVTTAPVLTPVNTVTTNQKTLFIQHLLTAIGAILAALGMSQAHGLWDMIVNSQVIGGIIVTGVGYLLSAIGVNDSNVNTLAMMDAIVKRLGELHPKS
jgi:lysozyme family protein